jgi:hypothetical protein
MSERRKVFISLIFVYLAVAPLLYGIFGDRLLSWRLYADARPLCSFSFYQAGQSTSVPQGYLRNFARRDRRNFVLVRQPGEFKDVLFEICQNDKSWLRDKDADLICYRKPGWQEIFTKKRFLCEGLDEPFQNI